MSDLQFLIRHLPRRKAPGPDGVPNELLQLLPDSFLHLIRSVINDALQKGIFPSYWKDTSYTLLTKKAPAALLTNQRPIALCNTMYKLYNIVINSRLTCMAEENSLLETEQEGGRRSRSTIRQLQRLRWNMDDARRRGKKLYVLWIDTTNAFCSINHKVLWSILRAYGIPELDVRHLEKQFADSRFRVTTGFGSTAEVHTHAGVGQGDITSPLLWNLVINALLRYLSCANVGYRHESGVMTSAMAYIDDCALLSESEHGMRVMVQRLNAFYKWAGLTINNAKCAVCAYDFSTRRQLASTHFLINGAVIPQMTLHDTYKYLGLEVSVGGGWGREKARVRAKLSECFDALKGSIYNPAQLDKVVRACLVPIFRYGAGVVKWTDRELDRITDMWCTGRRLAWKLPPGTSHCIHSLPHSHGGGNIPHAKHVWVKEMYSTLSQCAAHNDDLKKIMKWEWVHSREWVGCTTDDDAARELTQPFHPREADDIRNRFRKASAEMGATAHWQDESAQQGGGGHLLNDLSMPARQQVAALELSRLEDAQPLGARINRALQVQWIISSYFRQ